MLCVWECLSLCLVWQTEEGWHHHFTLRSFSQGQTYIIAPGENRAPFSRDASACGAVDPWPRLVGVYRDDGGTDGVAWGSRCLWATQTGQSELWGYCTVWEVMCHQVTCTWRGYPTPPLSTANITCLSHRVNLPSVFKHLDSLCKQTRSQSGKLRPNVKVIEYSNSPPHYLFF